MYSEGLIKHSSGLAFSQGEKTTLTILLVAVLIGLLAHEFGFHPAVGAYMAGLILKEEYFHFHKHPEVNYYENTKRIVDDAAFTWIGPVFFVELGSKIQFDATVLQAVFWQSTVLLFALFFSQVASAALAARYTGRFQWADSLMIGFGMLGRAELAFVVIDIGYVQYQLLTKEAFYTLMIATFWLNILVPVCIKLWKPYYLKARGEDVAPH